ncbi:MAG: VWA domain-containing protein [Terriglobales bacterium]
MQKRTGLSVVLFAALLVALPAVPLARAQMLPGAHVAPPHPPALRKSTALQQIPTITANVSLVNMIFSVEDQHGGFVPALTKADFHVLEDGKPQQIAFFSAENQLPLTLGLLLDTSPSQAGVLGEEQQISDSFFQQVIRPKDLAFVIGLDVQVRLLQDLTAEVPALARAVNGAHIGGADAGSYGGINPGTLPNQGNVGATHLWDAIYLACHDVLAHQAGRKAIIVVTDGGEQGSTYTWQDALRAALDSNTAVFAVMTVERSYGVFGGGYYRGAGPGELKKITDETGGRTINPGRHLARAFQQLILELRSQYSLGYHSNLPADVRGFRTVRIELQPAAAEAHPAARIRARSGYYAPGTRARRPPPPG